MVVVAMKLPALLIPVQRDIGGIDIKDQFVRCFVVAGDELLDQHPMQCADIGLRGVQLAADARLEAADDALEALQSVIDRATLCVCADALGAMDALLWKTVEYTKTRKQFGVPIASFQALQHRMAEMFIELEQSRSILMMALMSSDSGTDARRAVSAAKSRIGRAARLLGQEAIQLHGGIGVTDELDVGHYFKRLTAIEALFGNSDWHLRRFAALSN